MHFRISLSSTRADISADRSARKDIAGMSAKIEIIMPVIRPVKNLIFLFS
jgi:hypothetical protein